MKASAAELLARLPGKPTGKWPMGERLATAFAHGTMSLELYAPVDFDPQTPHEQDELYIAHAGRAELVVEDERHACEAGSAFFVPAGVAHRLEHFSPDFATWVIFWGLPGGETPR